MNTEWFYSLYVQDKWQVSRKLTLSYGLRWEYFAPPVGDMQRYDPANIMTSAAQWFRAAIAALTSVSASLLRAWASPTGRARDL